MPVSRILYPARVSGLDTRGGVGSHSSRPHVATRLKLPTRLDDPPEGGYKGGPPLIQDLFGIAPEWGCIARRVTPPSGRLLPYRFTLTSEGIPPGAVCFLLPCPWGCPRSQLTTPLPFGVRTFLPCRLTRQRRPPGTLWFLCALRWGLSTGEPPSRLMRQY